jgi:hypothetical protein
VDYFNRRRLFLSVTAAAVLMGLPTPSVGVSAEHKSPGRDSSAAEVVRFLEKGQQQTIDGRVVQEAADGGLLLEGEDGVLWLVDGSELISRSELTSPFAPLEHEEMADRLLSELPAGFRANITPHYVVCYNTSRAYAQWTSSLLERLYKAFTNYWQNQGLELREPEFPLAVVVFDDRRMYDQASRTDLPNGTGVLTSAGGIVGFYSLRSNRINMFDLTGAEAVRDADDHRGSMREINQMLSQPAAVPLVSTIVHEATHQIAFNCGLLQRFAELPLWLCEGMAVYFEAPDLSSTRGWRGIGKVNYGRLSTFRKNIPNWREGSLEELIGTDDRFRNPRTAIDAYADAWALNYYLIRYEPDSYSAYLKALAKKKPLVEEDRAQRIADFRKHFGDLSRLQRAFLKQMTRVK